jgi:hypothetical protein
MNMKRPSIEDTRTKKGMQSIGGNSVSVNQYSKMQDEYIDYLEAKLRILASFANNEPKGIKCKNCGRVREEHSHASKMCADRFSFFEPSNNL